MTIRPRDTKPRLLDLFCCGGGASAGYAFAGFDVTGVDIRPQPKYPFKFIQADALEVSLEGYDAVHASPPCQRYTRARKLQGKEHPDLLGPIRERLIASGLPWVIENVPGSPMRADAELCGLMFGLSVYRHRLFEASFPLPFVLHPPHHKKQVKMGRPVQDGDIIQVVGHFSNVPYARKAMGIHWLGQNELREAIPPAYTQWIGTHLMSHLLQAEAA